MKKLYPKLISFGAIVICIMAVIFTIVNISMSQKMHFAASAIYEHPYTVSNNARALRSQLLDMRQFVGLFMSEDYTGQQDSQVMLTERYENQDELIDIIASQYLGPKEDTALLREKTDQLVAAQEELLQNAADIPDVQLQAYLKETIDPYYDEVYACLDTVIDFADSKVRGLEQQSKTTGDISVVVTILLALCIIGMTIHTNRLLEQKRRRDVAYREKLFDLLSANVDDVFFIYDTAEAKLEYVSANSERILGITEEQFADRRVLYDMLSDEDVEKLDGLFSSGVIRMQAERDFRLTLPQSGGTCWMNLKLYPILEEERVTKYIVTISNQTERITVQRNLEDALMVAQNANRAKKDFLSRMSHEIRTPMNAIIGMTTIAAAHINDRSRLEDCLQKISFSSQHLLSLINDVLDMSKIEEGRLIVNHEPFSFRQLMESITAIVYAQARARELRFEAVVTGLTEEEMVGDSLRLSQILLNLLSNAVKFTPENGSVRLEVRQLNQTDGQVRLRFTVSDTGIGMSDEFLKRLYTPFEQQSGSTARRYGGTGLGMSITKNLVTLLGGVIRVKSREGEGTVFTVELPLELQGAPAIQADARTLDTLRVLVVDDDKDTCVHVDILLKNMGILGKWVLSGAEAVEEIIEAHETGTAYDVCFIDWQMPEMDGVETARQIREYAGPDTLIIIISAYDWGPIEETARAAGVNGFIAKPMFASSIYNTLTSYTGKSASCGEVSRAAEYTFSGRRILLAEDNELNMEIAVEILKMAQAEVECVVNGLQAVEKVVNSPQGFYDLVLMDIQMPVMDGYEAARKIRASAHPDAKALPILAMTADAFQEDMAMALESGMDGHITKPVDVELLYQAIEQTLQKRNC